MALPIPSGSARGFAKPATDAAADEPAPKQTKPAAVA
jgi:hypothetical protein